MDDSKETKLKPRNEKARKKRIPPSSSDPGQPQPFYLTMKFLLGFLSIAFYWAWIFSTYFTEVLILPLEGIPLPSLLLKGAGLAGATIFLLATYLGSRSFYSSRGFKILKMTTFVCGLPASVCALLFNILDLAPLHPSIGILIWILMGVGTAAALVQMDFLISEIDSTNLIAIITTGTVLGSILYLAVANMVNVAAESAVMLYVVIEGVILFFSAKTLSLDKKQPPPSADAPKASFDFKQYLIQLFLYSAAFGLAFCLAVTLSIGSETRTFIWVALCLPGPFLVLYSYFLNRFFTISDISRILLSCIAIALLPLPFVDSFWRIACCSLLVFSFTCYDMLSFGALTSMIQTENLNPIKYFSLGRFMNALGVVLGWTIGSTFFCATESSNFIFTLSCLLFVLFLVLVLIFSRSAFSPIDSKPKPYENFWQQSCEEISKEGNLSPRETEVFGLLARGRDTEYISNMLFISGHTVKTHIYHIYRKFDVHSQQDIIDLVEKRVHSKKKNDKQNG